LVCATLALLGTLLLAGCASAPVARFRKASPETGCITPPAAQHTVVGVVLSGGGSRAALFAAAGLEALGRVPAPQGGSVLEQVSYLSSVSGAG
jgi:NTE family protein